MMNFQPINLDQDLWRIWREVTYCEARTDSNFATVAEKVRDSDGVVRFYRYDIKPRLILGNTNHFTQLCTLDPEVASAGTGIGVFECLWRTHVEVNIKDVSSTMLIGPKRYSSVGALWEFVLVEGRFIRDPEWVQMNKVARRHT